MALIGWDPFQQMAEMQDRFDSAFGGDSRTWSGRPAPGGTWVPPVNICGGDGHEFTITAELPDVDRDDIQVTIENNTLTLRGEKKMDEGIRSERVQRLERSYGTFRRVFTLPNTVDPAKVRADYRDGVLTLTIPLREETKPKQIPITASV